MRSFESFEGAATLRLLAKYDYVWNHVVILMSPELTGKPHAALNLSLRGVRYQNQHEEEV